MISARTEHSRSKSYRGVEWIWIGQTEFAEIEHHVIGIGAGTANQAVDDFRNPHRGERRLFVPTQQLCDLCRGGFSA